MTKANKFLYNRQQWTCPPVRAQFESLSHNNFDNRGLKAAILFTVVNNKTAVNFSTYK